MKLSNSLSVLLALGTALAAASPTTSNNVVDDFDNVFDERACLKGISPATRARVQNAFVKSGVIPTLIPALPQRVPVRASYGKKAVDLGNKFTTAETVMEPTISFNAQYRFDPKTTRYSVFIVDPDVPGPHSPARMNFLHLYIAHASPPGCGAKNESMTVVAYEPLTPASTAQHRYTFLVYREPPGYKPDVITPQARPGFDLNGYTAAGKLKLVGGNFFREAITNT